MLSYNMYMQVAPNDFHLTYALFEHAVQTSATSLAHSDQTPSNYFSYHQLQQLLTLQ